MLIYLRIREPGSISNSISLCIGLDEGIWSIMMLRRTAIGRMSTIRSFFAGINDGDCLAGDESNFEKYRY